MKKLVVTVPIPKNADIRMMFEVATKLAGYPSKSHFFYASAAKMAYELLEENARRIAELDKTKSCEHGDLMRMTDCSTGNLLTYCNTCGKQIEESL